MGDTNYIKVLLPLNLSWMPTYSLQKGITVSKGDRVKVKFAGKDYVGVVYGQDTNPQLCKGNILPASEVTDLPPVSEKELELWEFVSRYYLCPMGEVCKTATPSAVLEKVPASTQKKLVHAQPAELPKPRLTEDSKQAVRSILEAFDENRNVLLCAGNNRQQIYSELSRRTVDSGRNVLILRPHIENPSPGTVCFASSLTASQKRNSAHLVRTSGPMIIEGESPAVFLPFNNLGLVIVDEEFSSDYKQTFHQPFYNARDVAYVLAKIWKCPVLLCARHPSLEALFNCAAGRLCRIEAEPAIGVKPEACCEIVDISRERAKNGMVGNFSRIALSQMDATLRAGGRILLLQPWKDTSDIEIEARKHYPSAGSKINSLPLWKADGKELAKYSLVMLSNIDYLFSRQDFRADEYAFRQIERLKRSCSRLLIQTSEPGHYVFDGDKTMEKILEQRRDFALPPFTREVQVKAGESVQSYFFAKDASLESRKLELMKTLPRGAVVDVDPIGMKF